MKPALRTRLFASERSDSMRCGQSKSFGDGRGDRPTAAMVKNHGGALVTHHFPPRSATVALNRWLEVGFYVCLRTKQASLL